VKATLDRYGRVVIPKQVRKQLGLKAGDEFSLVVEGGKISLIPVEGEVPLRKEGDLLVVASTPVGKPEDLIEEVREERMRTVAGEDLL